MSGELIRASSQGWINTMYFRQSDNQIFRPNTSNGKRYVVNAVDTSGVTVTKTTEPTAAFNRNTATGVGFRVGLVQVSAATGKGVFPIELTFTQSHGFTTGQSDVVVADVPGNTAANGTWTVTVTDIDKITLNGSTGNGDYIKGSPNGGTQPTTEQTGSNTNVLERSQLFLLSEMIDTLTSCLISKRPTSRILVTALGLISGRMHPPMATSALSLEEG